MTSPPVPKHSDKRTILQTEYRWDSFISYRCSRFLRCSPLDNARAERAQMKIPLRNNLRGIIEVPGEPQIRYFACFYEKTVNQ